MSNFTKTLIASALAVAVTGTATADPKVIGIYKGSKTKITISPSGCPNDNEKNLDTTIGFGEMYLDDLDIGGFGIDIPFAGCWAMNGFSFGQEQELDGIFIERKVDKDLTMAIVGEDLAGIIEEMDDYLVSESKCDVDLFGPNGMNPESVTVKKANGKLSKNGERVKVDIQIDGDYDNDSGKTRNIKAKINGKMDYDAGIFNPAFDCENILLECLDEVCIEPF